MKLAAFNFKKISAEKLSEQVEKIDVKAQIDITEIIPVKGGMIKSEEDLLAINFEYTLDYNPSFAKIEFIGVFVVTTNSKESKNILKEWKDKKIPADFKKGIYNIILRKSNIKALSLEDEMGLPLHIQLPFFKKEESL
ncbi:MAG: hypothetical protein ABIG37_03460 [Nanoarchaeota archaeon]